MPNPSVAVDALQKALDEERRLRIKAEEHITYLTKTTDYTPPTKEFVEKIEKLLVESHREVDAYRAKTKILEKQVKISKIVNKKINREIKTMKKDWASATEHLGEQISNLTKEVNELKSEIRKRQTNGLACMNSWERKSKQQLQQIDNQCEEIMKQKQLIDYYELREDYFEKFIEEWESGSHEWREFCEARAHKTGNEEHVGILFDD